MDWNLVSTIASVVSAAFTAVAALAAALATRAAFAAVKKQGELQRLQAEHEAIQSNATMLVDLWSRVGSNPDLLKFHGIDRKQLNEVGLDVEDLAYLIASFEAAGYYYEYFDKGTGPFPAHSLRAHMCASEATQKAWPLLKEFFVGSPKFTLRIEETIKFHKGLSTPKQDVSGQILEESNAPEQGDAKAIRFYEG